MSAEHRDQRSKKTQPASFSVPQRDASLVRAESKAALAPIPEDFTFDVRAYGSSVTLIVPPDVDVIFDVFAFMGNAINQAHESLGGGTRQQIRVVGSAYLGEVKVLVRER
ncbi:MAG TPA: hypothetical protein VFD67_07310 [Gemmatimonadaceae bacterium]|nr:hypothetical protein [Gemmatimonadaceae bacterium]